MSNVKDTLYRIRTGDKKTIQELYRACFPSVRQLILKNSGTSDEAEDIFQEALVVLFRKIGDDSLVLNCAVPTYLYSISRNIWLDKLRRRDKFKKILETGQPFAEADEDLIATIQHNERNALYQKYFMKLGNGCRQILQLFFEGYDMKHIAAVSGFKSEGYARKKKHQCKEKLISSIRKDPIYWELTEGNIPDNQTIKEDGRRKI